MRVSSWIILALLGLGMQAQAGQFEITVEIPRLDVAEYHRPYVALWLARDDQSVVSDLAVWYDVKMRDREGEKWLKDMRQWWRRSGRTQEMPIDGVTGATRAPGTHQLVFSVGTHPLPELAAGKYLLIVEAAREVGGRELLQIPFEWPVSGSFQATLQGETELGQFAVTIKP